MKKSRKVKAIEYLAPLGRTVWLTVRKAFQ